MTVSPAQQLPKLQGSRKQIRWAEQIRTAIVTAMEQRIAERIAVGGLGFDRRFLAAMRRFAAELRGHTSAEWWIYNRYRRYGDRDYLDTIIRARMNQEEDEEL